MRLPVLSPDINQSGNHFTPIIQNSEKGSIRFGLSAIKSVGESAAMIILEERDKNGPYENFYNFVYRVIDKNINKRVIEALIKTGAFDSFEIAEINYCKISLRLCRAQAQKNNEAGGQLGIFEGLDDSQGVNTIRIDPSIISMKKSDKLQYEKELLGIYLSGHPLDQLKGLISAIDSFKSEVPIEALVEKTPFRLVGVVNSINIRYTRKDNKKMATFTLNKKSNNFEMIAFSDAFAKFDTLLEEGQTVIVQGMIQREIMKRSFMFMMFLI